MADASNLKTNNVQQESLLDPFSFSPDFIFALYFVCGGPININVVTCLIGEKKKAGGGPVSEIDLSAADRVEQLKRRLGPVDKAQLRLLLHVSPQQRILTMLDMQDYLLDTWRQRLRQAHLHLSDLALYRLLFERLNQHG